MKKIVLFILFGTFAILVIRLLFFYTIITIPFMLGRVFEGGYKYDFPVNIVNPFKVEELENSILEYVKIRLDDKTLVAKLNNDFDIKHYNNFKWWFFERLGELPDFKIIAINNERDKRCLLLAAKDNPKLQCIVFMDKKTNVVKKIDF
jgi:hypothetical protein